jgi:hypothetical protein
MTACAFCENVQWNSSPSRKFHTPSDYNQMEERGVCRKSDRLTHFGIFSVYECIQFEGCRSNKQVYVCNCPECKIHEIGRIHLFTVDYNHRIKRHLLQRVLVSEETVSWLLEKLGSDFKITKQTSETRKMFKKGLEQIFACYNLILHPSEEPILRLAPVFHELSILFSEDRAEETEPGLQETHRDHESIDEHAIIPEEVVDASSVNLQVIIPVDRDPAAAFDNEHSRIPADNVDVRLSTTNITRRDVSLQDFLNAINAGDLFDRSILFPDDNMQAEQSGDQGWLGDQAYFFFRHTETKPFLNGTIAALIEGKLTTATGSDDLCLVISDKNAKWKGGRTPTLLEADLGHWCSALGQVPVCVEGAIRCGDCIGPKVDGSGLGVATTIGQGPVIGIAQETNSSESVKCVKTFCFAGYGVLGQIRNMLKLSQASYKTNSGC